MLMKFINNKQHQFIVVSRTKKYDNSLKNILKDVPLWIELTSQTLSFFV